MSNNVLDVYNSSYELSNEEKVALYNTGIFSNTFELVDEMIQNGNTVNGIHFLVPNIGNQDGEAVIDALASGDWKNHTYALGNYNGFEFRYIDTYIDGETDWAELEDIGTINWSEVISLGIKTSISAYLEEVDSSFINEMTEVINTIIDLEEYIDAASVRPNITYTYSAASYIKCKVKFRHYHRQFYMSDNDDRVYGYDYYIPGTSEKLEVENYIDSRYPTLNSWVSYCALVGERQVIKMSGYNGNSTLYSKLIQCYYSTNSATYHENIDLREELLSIMLNN